MTRILLLLFIALLSMPAAAQSVETDYDHNTDFSAFKTFAWLNPGDSVINRERPHKLYGGYIMNTANAELNGRGLEITNDSPDAIFMYLTSVQESIRYSQSPTLSLGVGVAGPGYYVSGYAPVAGGNITATTEQDGILEIIMFNTATGKVVWTATVKKRIDPTADVDKLVVEYTKRIFKKFPVKKSRS